MRISVSLILIGFIVLSFPVLFASDTKLILRAIHKPDKNSFETLLLPDWLADLKLTTTKLDSCDLVFTDASDRVPVIHFLVSAYGGGGVNNERVKDYIALFAQQGCNINAYDSAGMTALHAAVLFAQPELIKVLLDNKASLRSRIRRPGKQVDGMQALNFARYLARTNDAPALQKVICILKQKSKPL